MRIICITSGYIKFVHNTAECFKNTIFMAEGERLKNGFVLWQDTITAIDNAHQPESADRAWLADELDRWVSESRSVYVEKSGETIKDFILIIE